MDPITTQRRLGVWHLLLGVLAIWLGALWIAASPNWHNGATTIALYTLQFGFMLLVWRLACRRQISLTQVLVLGVALRLLLALVPAYTTHDLERYLWDGAVVLRGFDPYLLHPDHLELAELRAWWPTPAEHASYPTLYPPLALASYALAALAGPSVGVWVWKGMMACASLATLGLMARLLTRLNRREHLALFALSPIVLFETGIGAHVDALMTLCIALALWGFYAGRFVLAGLAIGLGVSTKLLPVMLLLPMFVVLSWADRTRLCAGALIGVGVCYGAALLAGLTPIGSLPAFFASWRSGSPLYAGLEALLPTPVVNTLLLAVLLVGSLWVVWRARRDLLLAMTVALALPLLVSPTVFPWYLLPLVPLCALRPTPWLLWWLAAVPLVYEVLGDFNATGHWAPAVWPVWAIALAWAIGAVQSARHHKFGQVAVAGDASLVVRDATERHSKG